MCSRPPPESDIEVQCPYVKSHRPLKKHFERHLVRCSNAHKDISLAICPFDQSHRMREAELNWHVSVCPARSSLETYKHTISTGTMKSLDDTPEIYPEVECSEDWSTCNVPSYDPSIYASNANVIRAKIGGTPSEKKAFKEAERKRLNALRK